MTAIPIDSPVRPNLIAFIERYRAALERRDLDAVCANYRLPLPVVRPDRQRTLETARELREEIAKILDFYAWAGMRTVELSQLHMATHDVGLDLATVTWRPRDAEGREIAAIDQTFAIRRTRDGARIAAVIAHNEERRRLPIIRESLASMEDTE